jgi:hypothetical protein
MRRESTHCVSLAATSKPNLRAWASHSNSPYLLQYSPYLQAINKNQCSVIVIYILSIHPLVILPAREAFRPLVASSIGDNIKENLETLVHFSMYENFEEICSSYLC